MDGLIIGTFTHPYTSNNSFYMQNENKRPKKKLKVCKDGIIRLLQQINCSLYMLQNWIELHNILHRMHIYFINLLHLIIHWVDLHSMHWFKNIPTQHTSLCSSDMLIWSGSTISNSFLGTRSKPRCLVREGLLVYDEEDNRNSSVERNQSSRYNL